MKVFCACEGRSEKNVPAGNIDSVVPELVPELINLCER